MAYLGMSYLVVAPIESEKKGQKIEYGKGRFFGEPISSDVSLERANIKLHAGNVTRESDNSITGGTVSLNVDEIPDDCLELMGFFKDGKGAYHKSGEATPYVGFGYIRDKIKGGKYSYNVNFFHKAQFDISNVSGATKGENTAFQTEQLAGTLMAIDDVETKKEDWYVHETFEAKADAVAFLLGLVNMTEEGGETE